jgi:hypothetical protein
MALMERICGRIDVEMVQAADPAVRRKLFDLHGKLAYPNAESTRKLVEGTKSLEVRPFFYIN